MNASRYFFCKRLLTVCTFIVSLSCVAEPLSTMKGSQMTNTNEALANEAETILNAADQGLESQEWSSVNVLLKHGLDVLGDRYVTTNTIDDSGMKLVLASRLSLLRNN